MSIKRQDELDPEEALELELLYAPRLERPQPGLLELPQDCLKQARGMRVAVVGAGLAGLMAARVLCQYGVRVTVFEAFKEVGGRVRSNTAFSKARITEEGAELIGSFHNKWLGLAQEYGLAMISRMDPKLYDRAGLDVRLALENQPLTMAEFMKLEDTMNKRVLKPIALFARQILDPSRPWRQLRLKNFDGMSVQEALIDIFKIAKRTKGNKDELLWKMIEFKLVNDEVAPLDKMNFLGLLCKVRAGQGKRFGPRLDPILMGYWDELEIFRCADGCQQLAKEMAKEITKKFAGRIDLNTMVKVIDILKDSVSLTWVPVRGGKPDRGPGQSEAFDFVILAIPPSVWDQTDNVGIKVDGTPVRLRDNPGTMGMQPAVKFFSDLKERFWIKDKAAPYGGALNLGQVWEGTDSQTQVREIPDPQGQPRKVEQGIVLSVFAGPILAGGRAPTEEEFKQRLEKLYPGGYTRNLNRTLFSDWPNPDKERFIKTGYASPEKNQIFTIGQKLNAPFHDRLFFAGEHTEMAFFGYMEGALRSGEKAAKRLMLKKCGLLKQPAPQPPSQTFLARVAPTREYAPLQQQVGIHSERELGAKQGWAGLAEHRLTPRPDDEEDLSLETEALPFSKSGTANPAQNILFVDAGPGNEFKDAIRLVAEGQDVLAIGPRETASARTLRRAGGKFVSARIEDLPPESCRFDLIRERVLYPSERHYSLGRSFALARLSRLKKGGRWILVTESPRYVSLLKAVGDYDEALHRNFTVTASSLAPDQAPSTLDTGGKARFRLIFQRRQ